MTTPSQTKSTKNNVKTVIRTFKSKLLNEHPTPVKIEEPPSAVQRHAVRSTRMSSMDAFEERFAQIFGPEKEDRSLRSAMGDDELMRLQENES